MKQAAKILTIVCATKNVGSTVEKFLFSYKLQKREEIELIFIDSCSTDDTLSILNQQSELIEQLLIEDDNGIYEAWNKGVRLARGTFICFIGADDMIANGAIDDILSIIKAEPDVNYIHGYNVSTVNGQPKFLIGRAYDLGTLEKYMPMAHVMSAHRKSWLIEKGMFDESYKSSGDYEFLLRTRGSVRIFESKKIYAYVEDNGISRQSTMPLYETFRAKRSHGIGLSKTLPWLVRGLVGHFIRHLFLK